MSEKDIKDNKKTENKKTNPNKEANKSSKKADKKPKIDYKKENVKLNEKIKNLILEVNSLKVENMTLTHQFQEKAKTFQSKAQEEVNRVKEELALKAEEKEKEFKKFASQKIFESIIEPLNNIDIAIKSGKTQGPEVQAYVMGFEMLMNQLFNELESFGLSKITPKEGEEFDPEHHQAISTEEGKKNTILKVKKPGFKYHERVIKPAIVIIGK